MEFWDDYSHPDPKITYIFESIKTREVEELIVDELCGCQCEKQCKISTCVCLQRSGAHYSFPDAKQVQQYVLNVTDTNKPIYECNENCKCTNSLCGNRLVQLGPRKKLKLIENQKGVGVVTEDKIEQGNFICEYSGEIVTKLEATKRFQMYKDMQLRHNYIFCVNENFGVKNEKTFIDPTFYGNIGRYINHSCQPNATLVPVRIQDEIPKLCIFSGQTIEPNSEITFNYGSDSSSKDKPCFCLAENCRKFLPFDASILTEDL